MYTLIDGKKTASEIRLEISDQVKKLIHEGMRVPHLAAVLVGDNPSSQSYVANKVKDCKEVGFISTLIKYDAGISEQLILEKISELNNDDNIDGFIIQLPLPVHISE